MGTYQQQPDGTWTNATPLEYSSGYDVEVSSHGDWQLYRDGDHLVATGRNRSRLMRMISIRIALWRDQSRS
jgi:hypothetical protein